MKFFELESSRRVVIEPGEYYVTDKPEVISTLLGSCVAACLYDAASRVIGMNHFLLAYQHYTKARPIIETEEGRYGLYAMELMINAMMRIGANKRRLQAKCFGGGNVLHLHRGNESTDKVGDVNVAFIKSFLQKENIPLVASDLGGSAGRNIHFMGEDFSVYVKPITIMRTKQLEQEERSYWQKNIDKQQQKTQSKADFW